MFDLDANRRIERLLAQTFWRYACEFRVKVESDVVVERRLKRRLQFAPVKLVPVERREEGVFANRSTAAGAVADAIFGHTLEERAQHALRLATQKCWHRKFGSTTGVEASNCG